MDEIETYEQEDSELRGLLDQRGDPEDMEIASSTDEDNANTVKDDLAIPDPSLMKRNFDIEEYEEVEKGSVMRYFAPSTPQKKQFLCAYCREEGHAVRDCPRTSTTCPLCLTPHNLINCPLADMCFQCFRLGHIKSSCPNTDTIPRRHCAYCDNSSHYTQECPSVWRRYKYSSIKPTQTVTTFCYSCARSDHFGDQCPDNPLTRPYWYFSAFSDRFQNTLPRDFREALSRGTSSSKPSPPSYRNTYHPDTRHSSHPSAPKFPRSRSESSLRNNVNDNNGNKHSNSKNNGNNNGGRGSKSDRNFEDFPRGRKNDNTSRQERSPPRSRSEKSQPPQHNHNNTNRQNSRRVDPGRRVTVTYSEQPREYQKRKFASQYDREEHQSGSPKRKHVRYRGSSDDDSPPVPPTPPQYVRKVSYGGVRSTAPKNLRR
ncbi:hypothetical protein BJ742DRAFT_236492 [Cladochytrium replicatum]|nr:hypothetical protein BJ742DRAFT_236492 [Cladochytrium replicatum]